MKKINEFKSGLNSTMLILGVVVLIFGVQMFYNGYHNIDLSVNMGEVTGSLYNQDIASDGNSYTYAELYSLGLIQVESGFFYALFGTFMATLGFADLGNMVGRRDL